MASLHHTCKVNQQTLERMQEENKQKFELEYNDFLWEINSLCKRSKELRKLLDINKDATDQLQENKVNLEREILEINQVVAILLDNEFEGGTGKIVPKVGGRNWNGRFPLKYVEPINEFAKTLNKHREQWEAYQCEDLEQVVLEIADKIDNMFSDLNAHIYVNRWHEVRK